jgi:hypothetical protein
MNVLRRFAFAILCVIFASPAVAQRTVVGSIGTVGTTDTTTLRGGTWNQTNITVTCYYKPASLNAICAGGGDFDLSGTMCSDNGATVIQVIANNNCYYRKNWGLNGVIDARQCGIYGDSTHDDAQTLNNCLTYASSDFATSRPGYSVVSTGGGQVLIKSQSITIPQGVTLSCGALGAISQTVNNDYTNVKSAIWLVEDPGASGLTISTGNTLAHSITGVAGIDGCLILRGTSSTTAPSDYSPTKFYPGSITPPGSLKDAIAEVGSFRGTAITADGDGFSVTNTTILGFTQCWASSGNAARLVLDHVNCDGTAGFLVNGGGGGTKFDDLNVRAFLTGNSGCANCNEYIWQYNSTTPSNSNLVGFFKSPTGGYAVYLNASRTPGNVTNNDFLPVNGSTVWVDTTQNHSQSAAGKYDNVTVGDTTTTLDSNCTGSTGDKCRIVYLPNTVYSDSGNMRPGTSTWSLGGNVITASSIDLTTLAVGMNVGSTTGCFATGTRIADINPNWGMIWISGPTAPSCAGMASNIQFWDDKGASYPPGPSVTLTSTERTGDGFATTGSAGVTFSNCQTSNHYVGFHVGDVSNLTRFVNCSNDNDGDLAYDGLIGLLCDGQHEGNDCSQTEWVNGVLGQHVAGAIVVNSDSMHGVQVTNANLGPDPGRQNGRLADINGGSVVLTNGRSELPGNIYVSNNQTLFVTLARQSDTTTYGSGYNPGDIVAVTVGVACSVSPQITVDSTTTVTGPPLRAGVPATWHQSKQGVCPGASAGTNLSTTTVTGTGMSTKGNSELVTAGLSMSSVVAPRGNLYLQGATAAANTNGCGNLFAVPTPYLCAPATVVPPPGGRLTLTSGQPVMTSDVPTAASVYYVPYTGAQVPIYNSQTGAFGQIDINSPITGPGFPLTLTLSSTQQPANALYDVFAETLGGSLELCAGPAWSSSTPGSAVRAVGLQQVSGIWVNGAEMTVCYSSTARDCPQYQCTYLGTFYTTAAGSTSQQFGPNAVVGGTANCLCLYNAYNQVDVASQVIDTNPAYTYSGGWRAMDTGAPPPPAYPNRLTVVDGLGQMAISAKLGDALADTGQIPAIGISLNSVSATPTVIASSSSSSQGTFDAILVHPPVQGVWFVQAMQSTSGAGANATFGGPGFQQISVQVKD